MTKTMSIAGGIKTYLWIDEQEYGRYFSDESPYGRKVKFLNKNGYDHEREEARKYFEEGQILTVKEIYVGGWSSTVEFVELPNIKFNTVMFGDI